MEDMPYLRPLINSMHQEDPKARPTAMQCVERFRDIKSRLNWWALVSPTSNMLRLYGYENSLQQVRDMALHRCEYLRLVRKATLTKRGRKVVADVKA